MNDAMFALAQDQAHDNAIESMGRTLEAHGRDAAVGQAMGLLLAVTQFLDCEIGDLATYSALERNLDAFGDSIPESALRMPEWKP